MKQLSSASPHAIVMVGIPGAGKTTFAEHFAETFQAPLLNSSGLQQNLGLNNDQAIWLRDLILNEYFKTNRTILIDGHLESRSKRTDILRAIAKAGYRPLVVWVQTDAVEARRRVTKNSKQTTGLSDTEFDDLLKSFQAPTAREKAIVISGKHTYTTQLKIVLKQIAKTAENTPSVQTSPAVRSRSREILIR